MASSVTVCNYRIAKYKEGSIVITRHGKDLKVVELSETEMADVVATIFDCKKNKGSNNDNLS